MWTCRCGWQAALLARLLTNGGAGRSAAVQARCIQQATQQLCAVSIAAAGVAQSAVFGAAAAHAAAICRRNFASDWAERRQPVEGAALCNAAAPVPHVVRRRSPKIRCFDRIWAQKPGATPPQEYKSLSL